MKNKKNVIIAVMIAVALLMATGYAYFATQLNINATGNITSNWNVYFESISSGTIVGNANNVVAPSVSGTSANMNVNLSIPGDSVTYNIVLKNGGTVGAIIEDINAVATGSSAIIYSISGLNIGDKLAAGASKTITVKIEYDPNTSSQPVETSKQLTVTIDAAQDIGQSIPSQTPSVNQSMYLSSAILKNNTAYADNVASPYVTSATGIDFSQPSSDTNGKGLYYTYTNTEDNKTTYYFRGDVENNYVSLGKFDSTNALYVLYTPEGYWHQAHTTLDSCLSQKAVMDEYEAGFECRTQGYEIGDDILWKIVRINEDGSVRLISKEGLGNISFNSFNYGEDDNAYVGYMHGNTDSSNYVDTHSNTNDSEVKKYLDNWYSRILIEYVNMFANDAGFCNDRSVAPTAMLWGNYDTALGYGDNYTIYGAYNRLNKLKQPQFKCPQTNDLFTTITSNKGNKKLVNPIGLLTADEFVYAGGSDSNSYLKNDIDSLYWHLMTPAAYRGDSPDSYSEYFAVSAENNLADSLIIGYEATVRPVINLKQNVEVELTGTGEPGTINNPYVIKTN